MAPFVTVFEVDRPPETVFAYATDPLKFGEWQKDIVETHWVPPDTGALGSQFSTSRRVPGGLQSYVQEVIERRPFASWAVHGVSGALRPSARLVVEPIDQGSRSRVTATLDFEGHGAGRLLVPLVQRATARQAPRSYERLKAILEGRQPG